VTGEKFGSGADELAAQLAQMARALLQIHSVEGTLETVVRLAVEIVYGCEHAGILTAERRGGVRTAAATGEIVYWCHNLQGQLREGPCYDALWQHQTFYAADMRADTRWPNYAPRAAAAGVGSVLGFQLSVGDDSLGALDLYSAKPRAFNQRAEKIGTIFAAQAAVAMAWAKTESNLREAIASRQAIGEACGILMERYRVTAEQAIALLRRVSQAHNIKVRALAAEISGGGEIPGLDADRLE
jgi:transcriptional regulator with GAF, ATPase, and Fis domain